MIEDREYLKRDLARIYTPHTRQAKSAMKKLREDINRCPELRLVPANYEISPCKLMVMSLQTGRYIPANSAKLYLWGQAPKLSAGARPQGKNSPANWRGSLLCLVSHLWFQFLGLVDHLLYLSDCGNTAADVELSVDLFELRLQVLGYTVTELLHGVNTCLLQQLGKLRTYAVDAEQVGMVRPAQNQFLADFCCFCQSLAALGVCTLLEQFAYLVDTSGCQLLCIDVAYTFDVNNLVIHNVKFLVIDVTVLLGQKYKKR